MADEPAIIMTMPLFIRLLEFAREDAKDDLILHKIAERASKVRKSVLAMSDYEGLVKSA